MQKAVGREAQFKTKMVLFQVFSVLILTAALVTGEQFSIDIEEQGTDFTESIDVDEAANTETIDVPQHNEVTATTFIHDFNRNVSLRVIRKTGECFVTDLADMIDHGFLVPPKKLKADLKAGQARSRLSLSPGDSEVEIVLQEWAIGRFLDDDEVSSLSDRMREACPRDKIRWLFRLKDSAVVRSGEERNQRDFHVGPPAIFPHYSRCRIGGAKRHRHQLIAPSCPRIQVMFRCQVRMLNCQYIYYRNCDAEKYKDTPRTYAHCRDSNTLHILDEVRCCRECCADKAKADEFFPHCDSIPDFNCH